jgi:putative transposase
LLAENALLRQPLIVLHRQVKTPRLTGRDRLSLFVLARLVPNWKRVVQIVQPDTLLRWHRAGSRLFWRFKSRRQRPAHRLDPETIALIQRLARENRLRGAERIRGELLKLDIRVAKRTIQKYMHAARSQTPAGQTWSTFLKPHGQDIWTCDFVPVVSLFFQTLYAFVIVHVGSRRVVHVNATAHPTDAWVAQQLRDATPFRETAKHLICDNDTKFGPAFDAAAKTCGLEIIHTPYEAPRANAICERFVGSVRRECLDHVLVLSNRQLVRLLVEYSEYFNPSRPHQGLAQQTPDSARSGQATVATGKSIARLASPTAPVQFSNRKLMVVPVLNGLHHSYAWVT